MPPYFTTSYYFFISRFFFIFYFIILSLERGVPPSPLLWFRFLLSFTYLFYPCVVSPRSIFFFFQPQTYYILLRGYSTHPDYSYSIKYILIWWSVKNYSHPINLASQNNLSACPFAFYRYFNLKVKVTPLGGQIGHAIFSWFLLVMPPERNVYFWWHPFIFP